MAIAAGLATGATSDYDSVRKDASRMTIGKRMFATKLVHLTERPRLARGFMRILIAIAYLIIFAPVAMIVATSFFSQQIVSFPPQALTLHWYANAWEKPEFLRGLIT